MRLAAGRGKQQPESRLGAVGFSSRVLLCSVLEEEQSMDGAGGGGIDNRGEGGRGDD